MRVTNELLQELVDNDGNLRTGPINQIGVLRLALDLLDARGRTQGRKQLARATSGQLAELAEALNPKMMWVTVGAGTPAWKWLTSHGFKPEHRRASGRKVVASFRVDSVTHEQFLQTSL